MTVTCLTHGPMKYRFDRRWWECLGFDGEGCGTQLVYDEDLAFSGAFRADGTFWVPNVEVR